MSTVSDLTTEINTNLPDNIIQAITPALVRVTLIDMVTRLSADDVVTASTIATSSGVAGSTTALFGNNTWKVPTVDAAHIATSSGSPSITTILYGDNTWKTAPSPTITGGGLGFTFDSRASAAGANIPTLGSGGPNWVGTSGYASAGDGGSGLYVRVGSTPAYSSLVWFSSLDGQKWGLVLTAEPLRIEQAGGGTGASGATNSAAIDAIHSIFYSNKITNPGDYGWAGPHIKFAYGTYNFSGPYFVKGCSIVEGSGNGMYGGHSTRLKFPAGSDGLVLGAPNDNGRLYNPSVYSNDYDSRSTMVKNLTIVGGWDGGTTYSQNHSTGQRGYGILSKVICHLENLYVYRFAEHGVYIRGGIGDGGASVEPAFGTADNTDPTASYVAGNGFANSFMCLRVASESNGGDGFRIKGADSNAGSFISCSATQNNNWGYNDYCFLGNFYYGNHGASNGGSGGFDFWSGWQYGAYQIYSDSNFAVFVGNYSEGDFGGRNSFFNGFHVMVGGLMAGGFHATPSAVGPLAGANTLRISPFTTTTLGGDFTVGRADVDGQIANIGGNLYVRNAFGNRVAFGSFTLPEAMCFVQGAGYTNGRSSSIATGNVIFPNGLWLGQEGNTNMRFTGIRDGLPSSGQWARGDQIDLTNPSAGGVYGYVCTTGGDYAGTPPVWKSKGNLAA